MAEEGGGGHGDGGPCAAAGSAQRLPPPPPAPAPQPGSQAPPAPPLAPDQLPQNNTLVALPIVAIENILSFMSYDEISQLRLVRPPRDPRRPLRRPRSGEGAERRARPRGGRCCRLQDAESGRRSVGSPPFLPRGRDGGAREAGRELGVPPPPRPSADLAAPVAAFCAPPSSPPAGPRQVRLVRGDHALCPPPPPRFPCWSGLPHPGGRPEGRERDPAPPSSGWPVTKPGWASPRPSPPPGRAGSPGRFLTSDPRPLAAGSGGRRAPPPPPRSRGGSAICAVRTLPRAEHRPRA